MGSLRCSSRGCERVLDCDAQLALVRAARASVEVGVREAVVLHVGDQAGLVELVELDGGEPCVQQAARVARRDCATSVELAVARVTLAE